MPRMTRAKAAEVAEQLHVDEDVVLDMPIDDDTIAALRTQTPERSPLHEITHNSGGSKDEESEVASKKKSTRGKKAGRNAKGKKVAFDGSTNEQGAEASIDEVENTQAVTPSQESHVQMNEAPSSQDATVEEESPESEDVATTKIEDISNDVAEIGPGSPEMQVVPGADTEAVSPLTTPPSPLPSAMPNVVASLRKDTSGMRSTSNKENVEPMRLTAPTSLASRVPMSYDAIEDAVVLAATPPAVSRRASTLGNDDLPSNVEVLTAGGEQDRAQEATSDHITPTSTDALPSTDAITAMDALEDALEKVSLEVPMAKRTPVKPKTRKVVPVVRTTKASEARMSLAQTEKSGNALATSMIGGHNSTRQSVVGAQPTARNPASSMLGRSNSVRQSTATIQAASRRVLSGGSKPVKNTAEPREKQDTVIPHSKPRPMSLAFPTPPPPPKSKKAPTTSAFQLPGEAVAAKLKAAREERAKRDGPAEGEKKPAFKARPVPAGLKTAPSIRQTTSSKFRDSGVNGSANAGLHKRVTSVVTSALSTKPRTPTTNSTIPSGPLTVAKRERASTATAPRPQPRSSLRTSTIGVAPVLGQRVPSGTGKGTDKGKEVFRRTALAKEAADKEKREKEGAAKRARVAASERGRQLSREWAERQKGKKVGGAGVAQDGSGDGTFVV
ncbi:hypothetical protein LTR62_000551 [Meristemomyces frigidus]|uniref:Uncharacterized protein n=1 Tax=Meristemomyces frigidus TaxID=1508187 RepID=A0AAN7T953_9PEZI|nr:hypothetical protein LTR62_000551 [Meristemomyces frigidus]